MARIKLKEILDSREDWNMKKLADRTGIMYHMIHKMCKGERNSINLRHISLIVKALELESVDDLIEYDEDVELVG